MVSDLADLGLVEAATLLSRRQISPVDLVMSSISRIELLDAQLHAFVEVYADEALAGARAAEQEIAKGQYRGELHGIPVAIKDIVDVAGKPTRAGSALLADVEPAQEDAPVVKRLKQAGAIILGKTTTHEFAFGVVTPPTRNPWNVEHIPGGSSGGSAAAVAAGMVFAAIGTDTGGSIRIPAACCGVVGLKPTFGRVGKAGVVPLAWSLDHVGPITRRVEDAAACLQVVAGPDSRDPMTADVPGPDFRREIDQGLRGLRLGIPDRHFDRRLQPTVARVIDDAYDRLATAGAMVNSVKLPWLDHVMDVHLVTVLSEAAAYHRARFGAQGASYGADVRDALELGDRIAARDYLQAQRVRRSSVEEAIAAFAEVDLLVTPTLPTEAPRVGQDTVDYRDGVEDVLTSLIRYTCPFNQTGLPAISVPAGFGANGLPIGLQFVAPPFAEPLLLRAAAGYLAASGWMEKHLQVIGMP
ncbi:MAG: amidase [Thermomicrobiales bacterium]|nr:MAG: amidase [Thermomicrobiales bacterium]